MAILAVKSPSRTPLPWDRFQLCFESALGVDLFIASVVPYAVSSTRYAGSRPFTAYSSSSRHVLTRPSTSARTTGRSHRRSSR